LVSARNTVYELVRSGAWPTPLLRFGWLIKVPRSSLLDLPGIPTTAERAPLHLTRQVPRTSGKSVRPLPA
jgi:hypothetical protein